MQEKTEEILSMTAFNWIEEMSPKSNSQKTKATLMRNEVSAVDANNITAELMMIMNIDQRNICYFANP